MSRTKGYKCYNIQCGSCIGKTLCGEPGDAALWCQDRVFDGGIHMDYKNLVEELNRYSAENQNHGGITAQAADAITDLLARAEAAEKEVEWKNKVIEAAERRFIDAEAENEKLKNCRNQCKIVCLLEKYNEMKEKMIKEKERAENAEAKCSRLDEARENANEATAKWEGMYHIAEARAEKAEKQVEAFSKFELGAQ